MVMQMSPSPKQLAFGDSTTYLCFMTSSNKHQWMTRTRIAAALCSLLLATSCSENKIDRADKLPIIPGPGSSFEFVYLDYDSTGKLVRQSEDTAVFVVFDTGLTMLGRSRVSPMSWFMGDTLYVSYD